MKETDIGEQVVEWLKEKGSDWEIYQEIRHSKYAGSPIADIVCIKGESVWVIEIKKSLNLDVIRQAENWKVDYRSVAVTLPKSTNTQDNNRWWFTKILYYMGIGTILVEPSYTTEFDLKVPTKVIEHQFPKILGTNPFHQAGFIEICRSGLTEGFSRAGAKGGGYWTPYKETMKKVRNYVLNNPGCGSGDIVGSLGKMHYSSIHSARTNLVKNLSSLEQEWCEVRRKGTYDTFFVREGK